MRMRGIESVKELREMESGKVKVFTTTTREKGGDFSGRIDEKMLEQIAPDYKERFVYLCGPEMFMQSVEETLTKMEFPMNNLVTEKFDF